MKRFIISLLFVVAIEVVIPINAQNKRPNLETSKEGDIRIAYVEVDSLTMHYKFCQDFTNIFEKKKQDIKKTLEEKESELQTAVSQFQLDIQSNKYTFEQAQAIQDDLQKQNADLQTLQQRLYQEFQTETDKYNNALRDSIQNYLKVFNKDNKYTLIFSKAGDNILYADKTYDITHEVIVGLNESYKGMIPKGE